MASTHTPTVRLSTLLTSIYSALTFTLGRKGKRRWGEGEGGRDGKRREKEGTGKEERKSLLDPVSEYQWGTHLLPGCDNPLEFSAFQNPDTLLHLLRDRLGSTAAFVSKLVRCIVTTPIVPSLYPYTT